MSRRKKINSPFAHLYYREPQYTLESGRTIERGEVIKIHGINATKFRFVEYVRRTDTGVEWIDCYELEKGVPCGMRSFRPNRIKPLPKKRLKKIKKAA